MVDRKVGVAWSLFAVIATVSSILVMRRPAGDRLSDLHIYYGAAQTVDAGRPLYEYAAANGGPFTYPPFAVLLLWPTTALAEPVLQIAWLVLTCAAIAAIAGAVAGAVRGTGNHRLIVAVIACAVMLSAPAQSNLRFGQVSVFIVLLALVDGIGLTPARWRGVLIGVAAAIKLTPLLFVVYLVAVGRYRDAGRAVAAFVACALVGAAVLPADSWTYWTGTILHTSRIGNLASLGNQSVHGMLMRAGVAPDALPLIWATLVAGICIAALLRARTLYRADRPVHAAVLIGCATVVASPVSWTHHQLWTVLAAMLLVAVHERLTRAAGVVLLAVMIMSFGVVFGGLSTLPAVQFLLENARAFGAVAVCLAGFGGVVTAAVVSTRQARNRRIWVRAATALAMITAGVVVLPLPAAADPTFKAYTRDDVDNPRYFFVCRTEAECGALADGAPIRFGTAREKTKVRVNGVVDPSVARLEYRSAPGGAPRTIPLVEVFPGQRAFSFRSANMNHGRLVAYGTAGEVIAAYTDELP